MTFSTTIARTTLILYLLPILVTSRVYKIALLVVGAIQLASNVVAGVLPLSICRNMAALWDIQPAMHTVCGDTTAVIKFSYYCNSVFSFLSVTDQRLIYLFVGSF